MHHFVERVCFEFFCLPLPLSILFYYNVMVSCVRRSKLFLPVLENG